MPTRSLLQDLRSGFLAGGLTYGSVVSVGHVVHNDLASVRDTAVLWAWCVALFGVWMAAMVLAGALPAWWARRNALDPEHAVRCDPRWWGLLFFNLAFWELFFLHGLTYDNYPFGELHSVWGMLAFLGACSLLIALGVWIASRLAFSLLRGAGRGMALVLVAGFALAHGVAVLLARAHAPAPPAAPTAGADAAVHPQDTGLRVIQVDLDGADWRVLGPLIAKGELPHFAEIVRRGTTGPLTSIKDSNSAVIWASIFSGKRPEQHGVQDFYRIRLTGMAGSGVFPVHRTFFKELAEALSPLGIVERNVMSRGELRALPLWEILDHFGVPVGVMDGYYYSFPALQMKTPGGFFVSYGSDVFYGQLLHEPGSARLGDIHYFAQPEEIFREVKPFLEKPDFEWQAAALEQVLKDHPQPRYVNLYAHEPDSVQHWFWKWYQPELFLNVHEPELSRWHDEIPRRYRTFDAELGKLLERVDEKTVLLVVSDHGHSPTILHQSYYSQHRHGPPGIFLAVGGPVKAGQKLAAGSVFDIYPTVLHLLGLPVPRDAAGHVLDGILDPAWLAAHPVATVPTYEGLWESAHQPGASSGLNREELEKLRALGYI